MNFDAFFHELTDRPLSVEAVQNDRRHIASLDNEALFQLPFICMVILMISKGNRKPIVSELGRIVGECLEQSIPAFKGSSQHLGWSANLRVRTVKAIEILELADLISIDNRNSRVKITQLGRAVIEKALCKEEDDLASNLRAINREYRNICVSQKLDMELFE